MLYRHFYPWADTAKYYTFILPVCVLIRSTLARCGFLHLQEHSMLESV